jgi:hypothetical protein
MNHIHMILQAQPLGTMLQLQAHAEAIRESWVSNADYEHLVHKIENICWIVMVITKANLELKLKLV